MEMVTKQSKNDSDVTKNCVSHKLDCNLFNDCITVSTICNFNP